MEQVSVVTMTEDVISDFPDTLSKDDQNDLQVTILAIQNLELQGRLMQRDLENLAKIMGEKQKELKDKSEGINQKYGITLGKDKVNSDGKIVRGG